MPKLAPASNVGTSDRQLAAFIAIAPDFFRLFPLRGAGRKVSKEQLLIARSVAASASVMTNRMSLATVIVISLLSMLAMGRPMMAEESTVLNRSLTNAETDQSSETDPTGEPGRSAIRFHFSDEPDFSIRLRLTRNQAPLEDRWDRAWTALFTFHDVDESGALDQTEAKRLPHPVDLHAISWGRFVFGLSSLSDWTTLDLSDDSGMTCQEMIDHYGRVHVGGPVVSIGESGNTASLNKALIDVLDTNNDGIVTRDECQTAGAVLTRLDANGDRLIEPAELVAGFAHPGTAGTTVLPPGETVEVTNPLVQRFPIRWSEESLAAPDTKIPSKAETMRFSEDVNDAQTTPRLIASVETADYMIRIRLQPGKLPQAFANFVESTKSLFRDADVNGNDCLEPSEVSVSQRESSRRLLQHCDRNRDDELSRSELESWLNVQKSFASAQLLVTLLDLGNNLYGCLDADCDGGLSQREQQQIWERLKRVGCIKGDRVDLTKLPRQMLGAVSAGHPLNILSEAHEGPNWFLKMDRNRDGDLEPAEFIGSQSIFGFLDVDGDGFVDASEAENRNRSNR